jgi:hypothetical protein
VVAQGGVDDLLALAVALQQLGADGRVAPLHLVVGGLAQVVQQAAAAAQGAVQADLLGQQARQVGHLDGVLQDVLRVAGPELQPPR